MFGVPTLKLFAGDRSAPRRGLLCREIIRGCANKTSPGGASGRARLGRLFRFARARGLSRMSRLDAERAARGDRCDLGIGPEENPAARRELGFVPDHADRDAIDVGNLGTAKAKRIVAAGLLLLGSVGGACRRPHRNRERRCEHQTELEIPEPDGKHESPQKLCFCELWVKEGGLARRRCGTCCRITKRNDRAGRAWYSWAARPLSIKPASGQLADATGVTFDGSGSNPKTPTRYL